MLINIGICVAFLIVLMIIEIVYYLKEKVLEVKYNELIPSYIYHRIELNHLNQNSFSKFNKSINELNRRF